MTDTATSPASTHVVGGRYELYLDEVLGSGGLAVVYGGRDLRARRPVAIKALREEFQADPDSRRRFRQEARMMAFTSHPGLVTIYDLIEQPAGSWIVMELVPGRNLKQIVEQGGPLSLAEAVRILDKVADALDHMHQRQIIHLDLKPQNIILAEDATPRLIDFGLAQSVGPRQETIGGNAFGTAAYLSPEQGRGGAVDQRTDVYSLGCVAYELFTGRAPFEAPEGPDQKRELIAQHLESAPIPPSKVRPGLPRWVDDVVLRAIAKSPGQRYQSVRDFADAALDGLEQDDESPGETALLPEQERAHRFRLQRRPRPPVEPDSTGFGADEDDSGPPLLRRAWVRGGRLARRARPMRSTFWRIALCFAIGNLILGSVLLAREGPEALVERFLAVAPATSTSVAVDGLNLREGPGSGYAILTVLPFGTEVDVTGLSESNDEGRWWPVELEIDGEPVEGWVWDGGLQPNAWTGRLSFMQDVVERGQSVRGGIADGFDTATSWWPF
jgi:predicted Ser/Thr protein kinase